MANGDQKTDQQLQPQATGGEVAALDDSSFANLLDPDKFAHMWRVAKAFAHSGMVPKHYQDKPEACFVTVQMAVRLGVDPFMALQKMYPSPDGKPAMEGQMAIALVNSRGPFTGPIQYEFSGKGDEYGCTAYAYDRRTGDLCSVRVTIGMAKAEGWYNRNPKWKNVPDLMLRYRSGAWLGRVYAPETLMGLQTVEEAVDVHGSPEKGEDHIYRPNKRSAQRQQQPANGTSRLDALTHQADDAPAEGGEAPAEDSSPADEPQDAEEVPAEEPAPAEEPYPETAPDEGEPADGQQPASFVVSSADGEILGEYDADQAEGAFRSIQSVIRNAQDPQKAYDINSATIRGLHDAGAENAAAWDDTLRKLAKQLAGGGQGRGQSGQRRQQQGTQQQAAEQGSLT